MTNITQDDREQSSPRPASGRGRKLIIWILGLVLLAGAGFLGYRQLIHNGSVSESHIVATVNDERITRSELDQQIAQLVSTGQLPPLEEIGEEQAALERSVLEQMIGNLLLIEDAQRQGVSVSEDEVSSQYDSLVAQVGNQGDDFEQLLAEEGIAADDLRQSLRDQLVLEAYFDRLSQEYDISVSEEEIRHVFDTQVSGEDSGIPFEAVEPQIRQQLEQQKLAEVLPAVIAELTEQAAVEIRI